MVNDPHAPGWNEGEPWSDLAVEDLREAIARGDTMAEIAVFLQRSEKEVREKITTGDNSKIALPHNLTERRFRSYRERT
jgi:hypothetical protein